ncbi:MAG TPA: phasin family protein [Casimicrobiaceae bacterium]
MRANEIRIGNPMLNASRQVWLAGLGAAVVTRDWAQSEAGNVFRSLVKEGTAIESKTIRMVGDRLESTIVVANSMWKRARTAMRKTTGTAVTLVQSTLPNVKLPAMFVAPAKTTPAGKRAVKRTKVAKPVKRVRRAKARTAK